MSRDWLFYLEDIRDSADKVLRYTADMNFDTFMSNDMVCDAVIRNLEILGEAAKHLPEEARALLPDIEWSKAAGFRDVIAHQYFGVDQRIVWDVVQTKIPVIFRLSDALIGRLRSE